MEPDPYSYFSQVLSWPALHAWPVFSFLLIPFFLFLSAVLSGAEKAFFSLSETDAEDIRQSSEKAKVRLWHLLENPRRTLATLFLVKGLTFAALLCLTFWSCWRLSGFTPYDTGFTFLLAALLFLLLLFLCEILPKVYYTHHPLPLVLRLATIITILSKALIPLTGLFLAGESYISHKFKLRTNQSPIEDLQDALDATMTEETTVEEKEILKGLVNFGSISVKQIMRQRLEITAFDYNLTLPELIPLIGQLNYSRVPVFRDSIDTIEGILYIKDLLPYLDEAADFKWQQLLRPVFFVPESKKINSLLKDFQELRVHMALIADEYGGTIGLATLEDIIEKIVGDIKDEFDDEDELVYSQLDENTYIFDAKTSLHNFCKITGTPYENLEAVKGANESLAGLMLQLFSRIPRIGAEITLESYHFRIEAADSKKVKTVKVYVSHKNNSPQHHA